MGGSLEEARAGLGGGAEAVLGPGPAQFSAQAGPDPPSQLPAAARHHVKVGLVPVHSQLLGTVQRPRARARRAVLAQRLLRDLSAS